MTTQLDETPETPPVKPGPSKLQRLMAQAANQLEPVTALYKNYPKSATAGTVATLLLLAGMWWMRPIGVIRGIYMMFYRHPGLFTISMLAGLAGLAVHVAIKMIFGDRYRKVKRSRYNSRRSYGDYADETYMERSSGPLGALCTFGVTGLVGFIFAVVMMSHWTLESVYKNSFYGKLTPQMLSSSEVRMKPLDVARAEINNSFNSPTDKATNLSAVNVDGKMTWTAVESPESFWRRVSGDPVNGIITVAAQSSSPEVNDYGHERQGNLPYTTVGMFAGSLGFQIHKICYTCDITEVIGMPTPQGPELVAPVIQWHGGWFVRHPEFAGVFIERDGGKIVRLSVKQAENDKQLLASGRVFPDQMARTIADAYAYKYGIANEMFSHRGQLGVNDTGDNPQPFLENFKNLGPQWVTTMKPRGNTFTTAAVLTTSAVTGRTRIWLTPQNASYIGNDKAISIVTGQSGLGVTFSQDGANGNFQAIEPRQVFPPGAGLEYLVSIVPNNDSRVTMNVLVNAKQQSVVAVFQADPQGDSDLVNYLSTGKLPSSEQFLGAGSGQSTGLTSTPEQNTGAASTGADQAGTGAATGAPTGSDAVSTLQRLLAENLADQRTDTRQLQNLKAEQTDLQRLLATAQKQAK